jgi:hypothetical protein
MESEKLIEAVKQLPILFNSIAGRATKMLRGRAERRKKLLQKWKSMVS